jgi:hypothetical protein
MLEASEIIKARAIVNRRSGEREVMSSQYYVLVIAACG